MSIDKSSTPVLIVEKIPVLQDFILPFPVLQFMLEELGEVIVSDRQLSVQNRSCSVVTVSFAVKKFLDG